MKASIVHKIPKLAVLRRDEPDRIERLKHDAPELYKSMAEGEQRQRASVAKVIEAFEDAGFEVSIFSQASFTRATDEEVIVCVGGDGTVLDVSHRVGHQPLLAVNSDPQRSVGFFCACDADDTHIHAKRVRDGQATITPLHRIAIEVNDRPWPFPCLNDVLVANAHPAMMSRYKLKAGTTEERHASSGMWISTPAGSTGGIRSAGGTVLPLASAMLQYLVREPYNPRGKGYRLSRGVRHLHEGLEVQSLMTGGRIYVDGPFHEIPFEIGDVLRLSEGPELRIYDIHPELRGR